MEYGYRALPEFYESMKQLLDGDEEQWKLELLIEKWFSKIPNLRECIMGANYELPFDYKGNTYHVEYSYKGQKNRLLTHKRLWLRLLALALILLVSVIGFVGTAAVTNEQFDCDGGHLVIACGFPLPNQHFFVIQAGDYSVVELFRSSGSAFGTYNTVFAARLSISSAYAIIEIQGRKLRVGGN